MLNDPWVAELTHHIDDRGSVYCIQDLMDTKGYKRLYTISNWAANQIRAWHCHRKGATAIHVVEGTFIVAAASLLGRGIKRHVLSSTKPSVFFIPPNWANGHMNLTPTGRLLILSTLSFEECKGDDERLPYNIYGQEIWKVAAR